MAYRPAIGQINFRLAAVEDIQNTENVTPGIPTPFQINDAAVSPLSLAQYTNYDIEQEENNFGLDSAEYLAHKGGFIGAGNRINIKQSDFTLVGNLTVRQQVNLKQNLDLRFNRITNAQRRGDIQNPPSLVNPIYNSKQFDNFAMTVGDFRELCHKRGMIMMWSGTYETLVAELPYWRLCAPPDSGPTPVNGIVVPNLESRFIVGGGYSNSECNNTYQPKDNINRNFDPNSPDSTSASTINLNIGTIGGHDAMTLTEGQMPTHKHNVEFFINRGTLNLTSSQNTFTFFTGGGIPSRVTSTAKDGCIENEDYACGCSHTGCGGCNKVNRCGFTINTGGRSINGIDLTSYDTGRLNISDIEVVGGVDNMTPVGLGDAHENRPPFYVLGFIIYVGVPR